jgi:hypothetical protein
LGEAGWVRLRRHFFGEYCNRRPWPCPKCGKRGNAIFIRRRVYSVPMLEPRRYQKMVEHPCCNERTHIEKPSTYYIPFSRQRREREEREWTERENRRLEMDAMECQRRAYEDAMPDQHAAGGWPLRALRPTNPAEERFEAEAGLTPGALDRIQNQKPYMSVPEARLLVERLKEDKP